jgi:alpha-ketoglutarate-dependent 2,4-dichlorophenoxyacetate dioxygenase
MNFDIEPLHPEFGVRLSNVSLASNSIGEVAADIDAVINAHSLVLFEDQEMDDEAHLSFTRLLGNLEEEHVAYYSRGEVTYVGLVGNLDVNGNKLPHQKVNSQKGNQMWHSDSSFREIPSKYSLLMAYEVPDQGGETEFASARSAYQRLDSETRHSIDNEVGIHDYIFSRTKVSEDAVNQSQRQFMHPVRQRLVRKNSITGEKNIYVGSHVRDIEGWENTKATPVIESLIAEITRPQSVYRHQWKTGDFMIWDNRCVLHKGCGYDAEKYRRRMHQTRVRGECPSIAE